MTYPDIETEGCGYRAKVLYDGGAVASLEFPGLHQSCYAARGRAQKIAAALRTAGETGVRGWVGWHGERPEGFPRNGIAA